MAVVSEGAARMISLSVWIYGGISHSSRVIIYELTQL